MSSTLETLLHDVAAQLANTSQLTIDERLAFAIELIESHTCQPVQVCEVRCAVFSRSALFHLGGAMVPTTPGEVEQFREQARGGFVQVGTAEHPHRVLRVGGFVLDPTHSAAWGDRGVWIRPFATPYAPPAWVADRLPFGVQIAYEIRDAHGTRAATQAA